MKHLKSLTLFAVLLAWAGPAAANTGVLVFGGTGKLGGEVVKDLVAAGEDVTVVVRPTSDRSALEPLGVAFVVADVLNEGEVSAALNSGPYRVVVDALARDGDTAPDFYIDSMKYMAAAAAETGVKQFILHGSVGAGLSRPVYPQERWDVMGPTIQAKDFGERYLMESGVPYTIIRNLVLLPLEVTESGEVAITTDQTKRGVITRDALGRLTVECLDNDSCINEIFHAYDDAIDPPGRYKAVMESFQND